MLDKTGYLHKTNIYKAGYCTLLTQFFNSTPSPDHKVAFKGKVNKRVFPFYPFILNLVSAAAKSHNIW